MDVTRLSDGDLLEMGVTYNSRAQAMEHRAAELVVQADGLRHKRDQLLAEVKRRRGAA